jgi:hypothetical protein
LGFGLGNFAFEAGALLQDFLRRGLLVPELRRCRFCFEPG